jgi:hypothetical protein
MMRPPQWYILDPDNRPVLATPDGYNQWIHDCGGHHVRIVEQTKIGHLEISTVFLGMDHRMAFDNAPVLWETMIFNQDGSDIDMAPLWGRYHSHQEARLGHKRCVWEVRSRQMQQSA